MNTTGSTILVIEDDQDIRDAVLEALEEEGFVAVGSADGGAALEFLRRADPKPALILLDLRMPEMSGAEFRRAQLDDPALASTPVVIFSADTSAKASCDELGAVACLKKPVKLDALIDAARRFTGT